MANRKNVFDLAPSYLERKKFWVIQLKTEEIEDIDARKSVRAEIKWTWVRVKALIHQMEFKGVLSENGKPLPIAGLAKMLRLRPSSVGKLDGEIKALISEGVLKKYRGFVYDPSILAKTMDQLRKVTGKYYRTFEEFLDNFPQILANLGEICESFDKTCENSENDMSALADNSNPQVVDYEATRKSDLSNLKNSNVRNSNSTTNSTTNRSTVSSSSNSTDTRQVSACDARETGTTRQTTDSPHSAPLGGAPAADWITDELRAKFPHLDLDVAVPKWLAKSREKGWKLTPENLRKFLAREKQGAAATPKQSPKRRAIPIYAWVGCEGINNYPSSKSAPARSRGASSEVQNTESAAGFRTQTPSTQAQPATYNRMAPYNLERNTINGNKRSFSLCFRLLRRLQHDTGFLDPNLESSDRIGCRIIFFSSLLSLLPAVAYLLVNCVNQNE